MHPGRVTSDTERDANAKKLIGLAQTFLDHVCASAEFCPVYGLLPHIPSFLCALPGRDPEVCELAGRGCSSGVRTVMRAASLEVRDRWPHLQWRAIASLLFLRFLSPGIVNPAAIGHGPFFSLPSCPRACVRVCACVRVWTAPSHARCTAEVKEGTPRTLLLVSKMVNNLMNEVAFGDKEPFMVPLNSFLNHQNKEAVQRFVQNLTVRTLLFN
jgi:hypothetical protein